MDVADTVTATSTGSPIATDAAPLDPRLYQGHTNIGGLALPSRLWRQGGRTL